MTLVRTHIARLAAGVVAAVALAACSGGPPAPAPPADNSVAAPVYVAVGGAETVGDGTPRPALDSWVQRFFRDALPADAVFVNLGRRNVTAAEAARTQVPVAATLAPTIATVWLGAQDVLDGVPVDAFGADLRRVIDGLRAAGATTVLVADMGEQVSRAAFAADAAKALGGPAAVAAAVAAYDAAIRAVVADRAATLVDLHASAIGPTASADGRNPDTAAHARIAEAFAAAAR